MKNSITYVGLDVHKNTYSACCYNLEDGQAKFKSTFNATIKNLLKYLESIKGSYPVGTKFICGYEAGFLGYSLYRELENYAVECWVLAPATITNLKNKRIKTDKRDAENIAKSMAFNTASKVYVLDEEDEAVREFIRMRDGHKDDYKRIKQRILSFLKRQNVIYEDGSCYWTVKFIKWLYKLEFDNQDLQDTFNEFLITFRYLDEKIERFDKKIEDMSKRPRYLEKSNRLQCFYGIKAHTALCCLVEIGDFNRFRKAQNFASFLGFVPSEHSSGDKVNRGSITKSGNLHLRVLITESAQCFTKGRIGFKSKSVITRQNRCTSDVIAYADKANERLRRRFYNLTLDRELPHNKAKTAIARELCCFIWGMMTDNIQL